MPLESDPMPVARPPGVQCPKWEPASTGSKRCRYYIDPAPEELQAEGLCKLPDEMVCVEWVRRFGTDAQRAALKLRQYPAGNSPGAPPVDPDAPPPLALAVQDRPPPKLTLVRSPPPAMPSGEPLVAPGRVFEFTPAKEVDPGGLEALERAGAEVDLAAPYLPGLVTLVPARTGRTDRNELSFREAAVLRMVVDAFPGAHVVGYRTAADNPRPTAPDEVLGMGHPGDPLVYPSGTPLGTACSVCLQPQFASRGGATCPNGHGGAPPAPSQPLVAPVDPLS